MFVFVLSCCLSIFYLNFSVNWKRKMEKPCNNVGAGWLSVCIKERQAVSLWIRYIRGLRKQTWLDIWDRHSLSWNIDFSIIKTMTITEPYVTKVFW